MTDTKFDELKLAYETWEEEFNRANSNVENTRHELWRAKDRLAVASMEKRRAFNSMRDYEIGVKND